MVAKFRSEKVSLLCSEVFFVLSFLRKIRLVTCIAFRKGNVESSCAFILILNNIKWEAPLSKANFFRKPGGCCNF